MVSQAQLVLYLAGYLAVELLYLAVELWDLQVFPLASTGQLIKNLGILSLNTVG